MNKIESLNRKKIFNKNLGNSQLYTGFTLAEVLVTLGIIGIVAAMTIPTLISNQQAKATVTALKKAYSTLTNAYTMASNDNGPANDWDLGVGNNSDGAIKMLGYFAPYLNITKNCKALGDCFPDQKYSTFSQKSSSWDYNKADQFAKAQLADGTLLAVWSGGGSTGYGLFVVDVNGFKKPNRNGADTFWFQLIKNKFTPYGGWNVPLRGGAEDCDQNSTDVDNGRFCTAWALQNENIDYIHCNDLAWGIKTKCN